MRFRSIPTLFLLGLCAAWQPAVAQHADHAMHHASASGDGQPTEPGDAAFAAITEITQILMKDPETDWNKVDIDALRQHLVDMNSLISGAVVTTTQLSKGVEMLISVKGRPGEAALRMVPAHAPVLAEETGWASSVDRRGNQIVWTVEGSTAEEGLRIRALGFFGLMATGDHHRVHHLALARGEALH